MPKRSHVVRDITSALERWAPLAWAYAWDRAGLALGQPDAPVSSVLTCLTVDAGVVRAARKARAQLVVAHHPPIWEPLKCLRTDDPHTQLLLEMAAADIACYAAHTNLDVAPGGVSAALAAPLGLHGAQPLFPAEQARQLRLITFVPADYLSTIREAVSVAGAGVIGDYTQCSFSSAGIGTFVPGADADPYSGKKGRLNEEAERKFETVVPAHRLHAVLSALLAAHPYEEVAYDVIPMENRDPRVGLGVVGDLEKSTRLDDLTQRVCRELRIGHARVVGAASKRVRRVAVLAGSGGGEIAKLPDDVDVYVTGDVKYHDAQLAESRGIAVIDAGHRGTERHVPGLLAAYLHRSFPALKVRAHEEAEIFRPVLRHE